MKIGIIGAMDEEMALLLEKIENPKKETVANTSFTEGQLAGKEVILLKSGIGKVNAAMATTILMERFSPSYVINTGSAGGFSKELSIGDLVVSKEVVHHDVDATAFDYVYGQVPQMPPVYKGDPYLIKLAKEAIQTLNVKAKTGLIATGDSFMENPRRVTFIRKKFPHMLACEMEAAGIAQVCYQYKVPFVIIRALSDIAGKEASISFDVFLKKAANNAVYLIMEMLNHMKTNKK